MFKDPAAPKKIHPKRQQLPGEDYSLYYANPGHDKLMSGHCQCGEDFGVGMRQPVGSKAQTKSEGVAPKGAMRFKSNI